MSKLYEDMLRIENYQSSKPLYKQIAEIKGMASTARYAYEISQPKLSIPKKIADSIVKLAKYHQKATAVNGDVFGILDATEWLMNFMSAGRENVMNLELFDYLNQDKSGHIETCIAFMNPLTRPFVEVTDE